MKISIGINVVLVLLIIGIVYCYYNHIKPSTYRDARTAMWVNNFLKTHNGWTAYKNYGSYLLVSFDHGKTWYSAEHTDHEAIETPIGYVAQFGFKNLKPADPELLDHVNAFDGLIEMSKRGGANLNDPADVESLRKAGITVTKK